jgi:hypothetical protein
MKELYTYEFKCYKTDQNAIDGVDFARSIGFSLRTAAQFEFDRANLASRGSNKALINRSFIERKRRPGQRGSSLGVFPVTRY